MLEKFKTIYAPIFAALHEWLLELGGGRMLTPEELAPILDRWRGELPVASAYLGDDAVAKDGADGAAAKEARDGRVCGAGGGVPGDPTVAQGVIGGGENFGGCDLGGNEPDEGAGGATTASDMDVEEGEAGPQAHHRKTAARSLRLAPVDGRPRLNLNGPHCVSIDRLWVRRASYAYLTNRRPHDSGSSSTTERRPAKRLHVTRHPPRGLPNPRSNARTPAIVDAVTIAA